MEIAAWIVGSIAGLWALVLFLGWLLIGRNEK